MRLEMYRGDSALWPMTAYQADGQPLNISTGSLYFTVKSSTRQLDAAAILQKTVGSGITVTDGANGGFTVELDSADTSSVYAPQVYQWDIQYVTTGNKVYTLLGGDILIKADVTRDIS